MDHQGRVTIVTTHLVNAVNSHDLDPKIPGLAQMTPTTHGLARRSYKSNDLAPNIVNKSQLNPRGINQSPSKLENNNKVITQSKGKKKHYDFLVKNSSKPSKNSRW